MTRHLPFYTRQSDPWWWWYGFKGCQPHEAHSCYRQLTRPPKRLNTFASNWQLPSLNQRKEEVISWQSPRKGYSLPLYNRLEICCAHIYWAMIGSTLTRGDKKVRIFLGYWIKYKSLDNFVMFIWNNNLLASNWCLSRRVCDVIIISARRHVTRVKASSLWNIYYVSFR